jgi:putative transposase
MAAITVRECVDLSDHLVMKPDGNFVDLESFILNPESYVSQQRAHPLVDFGERASEINSVTCSIFSCPFPGFAEHSGVKFTDVYFIQGVSLFHYSRTKSPRLGLQDIDYPLHDKATVVTRCGRICLGRKKINFSQVFAGQAVGIKEVHDDIWLVSFLDYDLGYFDLETRVLEPLENPFGPKVLPMS